MSTRRLTKELTLISLTPIAAFISPLQRARRSAQQYAFQAADAFRTRLVERNYGHPEDLAGEFRAERPDRRPFRDGPPSRAARGTRSARLNGESHRSSSLHGRRSTPCPVS